MTMNSAQRHEIVSGDEQYRCVGDGKCFDDVFESSPLNANIVAVSTVYIMLTTCNHCLPIISVAYYYYAHGVATNAHTLCPKQIRSHAIIFGNCFSKQKTFVVVGIIQFWRRKKEIKRKQNFNFFFAQPQMFIALRKAILRSPILLMLAEALPDIECEQISSQLHWYKVQLIFAFNKHSEFNSALFPVVFDLSLIGQVEFERQLHSQTSTLISKTKTYIWQETRTRLLH